MDMGVYHVPQSAAKTATPLPDILRWIDEAATAGELPLKPWNKKKEKARALVICCAGGHDVVVLVAVSLTVGVLTGCCFCFRIASSFDICGPCRPCCLKVARSCWSNCARALIPKLCCC